MHSRYQISKMPLQLIDISVFTGHFLKKSIEFQLFHAAIIIDACSSQAVPAADGRVNDLADADARVMMRDSRSSCTVMRHEGLTV